MLSSFRASLVVFSFSALVLVSAGSYGLTDFIEGQSFYDAFEWETLDDPTHGKVNYVDAETSYYNNLTYASQDTFILRADYKSVVPPQSRGRDSVRIVSKSTFMEHVAVFDVRHMPEGCGTWPAIWEVHGDNWPEGGEVDILEGVNDSGPNAATLHTTPGCSMPGNAGQTGYFTQFDCNYEVNGNTGCSARSDNPNSYGPNFNRAGGGWYVLERTETFMKIWFWERYNPSVPASVRDYSEDIDTSNWGAPFAYFPSNSCDMRSKFQDHSIIINLTFCGDWAGGAYGQSGCPSSCEDFVMNNPHAFTNAFFDFGSIRVYQPYE
ncbi:glycoside hydrolase family 16 protein [Crepidotus variabilis]|uniref:Glycoside hydrolase family 16 protein n=1 Tax=Crepidotus variabilis TaxID=179855 RepID=A0A9P6EFN1_9AGAR|nr:glycoside hydrolase family 16 protein [Crepidotus variabilis]